jgi:hypothetical protein
MTVLGCVDFRLTGRADGNSHDSCDVLLFADGRISAGSGKLTDAAPKIHVLDICVSDAGGGEKRSAVALGFAGTSALTALSAIAFASNVLRQLSGSAMPTVSQVGSFISHAFRAALEEYSSNQMRAAKATLIVAGFDELAQRTVTQTTCFAPRVGTYEIESIATESYLTVLSGPQGWGLRDRLDARLLEEAQKSRGALMWNAVNDIEEEIRMVAGSQPFGGQLQLCVVDMRGPRLLPTKVWDFSYRRPDLPANWNEGDYRTTMLGYDVFDLRVGQCDFVGHPSIQLPDAVQTPWAKSSIPCEERPPDDGDLFSRPRSGVLRLGQIRKE